MEVGIVTQPRVDPIFGIDMLVDEPDWLGLLPDRVRDEDVCLRSCAVAVLL